jgi:hypothetical protein
VVPNPRGLAVGPQGLMKSPALAEALRPLSRLVSDAHAQYEEEMLADHFRVAEARARRHDLIRRLREERSWRGFHQRGSPGCCASMTSGAASFLST